VKIKYKGLSQVRRRYILPIGSYEVGALEKRKDQPRAEYRKTCGRGAK
jgi:hypothetical protein